MDAAQPENRNLESGGGGGGGPREGGGLEAWLPVEGGDDDGRLGCVTNFLSFFLSPFSLSLIRQPDRQVRRDAANYF